MQDKDWQRQTYEQYRRKGFAAASGFGRHPALLIVDFINGFTDPSTALGGNFSHEIEVTRGLLARFRQQLWPVVYTTVAYNEDYSDAGRFIEKVPALSILVRGTQSVAVDDRIAPQAGEHVAEKQFASAFFGTDVAAYLQARGVDTVVITGCTTSGCVRASAVDAMQHGFYTVVVRDGVGDRAQTPHEANLFDMDAKYADVLPAADVHANLETLRTPAGGVEDDNESFLAGWQQGEGAPPARADEVE
ncbi:MAG: isochorismatase family protein [Gammaproteobacteria bacterium]